MTGNNATATSSESAPLLGPTASEDGQVKSNGTLPITTKTSDSDDTVDDVENGDVADANDAAGPKITANMATLAPALAIGIFLTAMDQTLTIATYGKMGSDLNALNNTSWIATSYFLTLTTFQPLYGKLSDIFGRKDCLLFSYSIFGLGCLGCGLARDIVQLCIARAVAGVGGGGMNAIVTILVTDLVPLRDRGIWQGYINIMWTVGVASGAPIGGLLADSVGWRWAFTGQFPIAVVAFVAVYHVLDMASPEHSHWFEKVRRIDFLGGFTLSCAAFALMYGLDNGSNEGWNKTVTIVPLALTPLLFGIFVLIEVYVASHPFAPGHVIFHPPLLAAYLANFFGVAAQMGVMFFIALFYQAAMGLSAATSGLMFIPSTVAGLVGSLGGGFIMRRTGRYYWLTMLGYGILTFSLVPLVLFTGPLTKSVAGVVVGMTLVSLGTGTSITTTLIAVIANTASGDDTAVAIACSYLFRSLGTSIGISTSTAVLQQVLRIGLAARLNDGGRARDIEERVRQSLDYIWELPPEVAAVVRDCYAVATTYAFIPVAGFCLLTLLSASFIWEKRLDR